MAAGGILGEIAATHGAVTLTQLVRFADPNDKGKLMLMVEDAMWLYMPSTSQPIRVTPLQRLSGNASNGDVAQTSLTANYTAALVGDESLEGEPAHVLELTAKRKSATYQIIGTPDADLSRAELKQRVYGTDRPSLAHEIDWNPPTGH